MHFLFITFQAWFRHFYFWDGNVLRVNLISIIRLLHDNIFLLPLHDQLAASGSMRGSCWALSTAHHHHHHEKALRELFSKHWKKVTAVQLEEGQGHYTTTKEGQDTGRRLELPHGKKVKVSMLQLEEGQNCPTRRSSPVEGQHSALIQSLGIMGQRSKVKRPGDGDRGSRVSGQRSRVSVKIQVLNFFQM